MVFAGTVLTYGRGLAVVSATGPRTEFGRIAQMLLDVEVGRTPLQVNLDKLGRQLARAAIAVVALIVALGLVRGQPFIEMLVFGIALAVAVVPEALPAVVTISLALGVQRLVRRRALMRRLAAVETLGSTSVICTDKTGTLTRDEMTVRRLYVAGQFVDVTGAGYAPDGEFRCCDAALDVAQRTTDALGGPVRDLLTAGALASDAHLVRDTSQDSWTIRGDPTEGALVVAAAKAGLHKTDLRAALPRVHEIPFSSESKRMTTLHAGSEGVVAFAKGAPEVILAACSAEQTAAGPVPLDAPARARILEAAQQMARRRAARAGRRQPSRRHARDGRVADDAARPGRHVRSAATRGTRCPRDLRTSRHPGGDDHRRPSAHGRVHRPRDRRAEARSGGHRRRARRPRRRRAGTRGAADRRLCAGVAGRQAAGGRGAAAARPRGRDDRRRRQRRARAEEGRRRHRDGRDRHGRRA